MPPVFSKFCTLLLRAGCPWADELGGGGPPKSGGTSTSTPRAIVPLRANTAVALSVDSPSDRLPHRLRRLGRSGAVVLLLEMARAVGAAAQGEMRAPLQEAIHDRLRQISIMHDIAPGRQRFVGRDEDRALREVALVDDLVEYVRRVGGVGEIAELVDHEHVGVEVRVERRLQASAR